MNQTGKPGDKATLLLHVLDMRVLQVLLGQITITNYVQKWRKDNATYMYSLAWGTDYTVKDYQSAPNHVTPSSSFLLNQNDLLYSTR